MTFWKRANNGFDQLIQSLAAVAGALIMLTVFLVCGDIGTQVAFGRSLPWVAEIVEYSLLWLTFLGTTWVLKKDAHIKMDMVINRLNPIQKSTLNVVTSFLGAIVCLIITWYSAKVTWQHFQTGYKLLTHMSTPSALINFIIPVGFALLTVQFVRRGLECFKSGNTHKNSNLYTSK
jgi:TRAP-type C4-dicarboxylate transport system permease small subunit